VGIYLSSIGTFVAGCGASSSFDFSLFLGGGVVETMCVLSLCCAFSFIVSPL
jgi:hypothetical protein